MPVAPPGGLTCKCIFTVCRDLLHSLNFIHFSWRDNSSYRIHTLGQLCLSQFFNFHSVQYQIVTQDFGDSHNSTKFKCHSCIGDVTATASICCNIINTTQDSSHKNQANPPNYHMTVRAHISKRPCLGEPPSTNSAVFFPKLLTRADCYRKVREYVLILIQ